MTFIVEYTIRRGRNKTEEFRTIVDAADEKSAARAFRRMAGPQVVRFQIFLNQFELPFVASLDGEEASRV